ncbi:MAG TPA: LLM class flavin-dependent oxidoreductase [Chloroflexota bacterium]|nr:LLM class flavin-dependent oxidoreductase [Chloroflexota bacterium]
MQLGVFLFGNVDMPDAGYGGTEPQDRRYGQADFVKQYDDCFAYASAAETLGYDAVWLTEHHFQHEGYEVVPNTLLLSAMIAMKTERIRLGGMFHVIPQWHPLRFAEDFAMADVVSRGRMICGIGRGTVPRESTALGARMGWNDSPDDLYNRELFEEQVAIVKKAWHNETFSHRGKQYTLPADGLDDRGRDVTTLTLIPKPWNTPVEIWQPVTSPKTYEYVARERHKAVYWVMSFPRLRQGWRLFQDLYERYHDEPLRRGENRMLVINVTIGDSTEHAMSIARNGHDEFWRFLAPYGRQVNYLDAEGKSWPNSRYPSLEESMEQGTWVVGSGPEVADRLAHLQMELGIEHMTIFPQLPGMDRAVVIDQLERFAEHVSPVLRSQSAAIESALPSRVELTGGTLSDIEGHQAATRESIGAIRR